MQMKISEPGRLAGNMNRMALPVRLLDLDIDTTTGAVRRGRDRLDLPELSRQVLLCLLRHAPQPVSATTLAAEAWQMAHVSDDTITQRIALLRRALGDDPKSPRYVRTVRGAGYALAVAPATGRNWPMKYAWPITLVAAAVIALLVTGQLLLRSGSDSSEEARATTTLTGPTPGAADLLERARQRMAAQDGPATDQAIIMLRQAIEIDPAQLDARVVLSFALSTRVTKFSPAPGDILEAENLARGVVEQDPDRSDARHALGYALDAQGRIDEAIPYYQQAFALNPSDSAAMSSAAYLYAVRGDLYRALTLQISARTHGATRYGDIQLAWILDLLDYDSVDAWFERARTLDPGQTVVLGSAVEARLRHGDAAGALALIDGLPPSVLLSPRILTLAGRATFMTGDRETALSYWQRSGGRGQIYLALADAMDGQYAALDAWRTGALAAMQAGDSWPELRVLLAESYSLAGRDNEALTALSQAIDLGWRDIGQLNHSPFLTQIRERMEYAELTARLERILAAQRNLVEQDAALAPLIAPAE